MCVIPSRHNTARTVIPLTSLWDLISARLRIGISPAEQALLVPDICTRPWTYLVYSWMVGCLDLADAKIGFL